MNCSLGKLGAHCPDDCDHLAEPYHNNPVVKLDEFDKMVEIPHW